MDMKTGSPAGTGAMILLWACVWAMPGAVIEAIDNVAPSAHWFTRRIDMWMQTLAIPGLIGGVVFSALLMVTTGRRTFAELSLPRSTAWGAVAGLLTGVIVVSLLYTGLSARWQPAVTATGLATLLGSASGFVAPLVFRYIAQRRAAATS